MSKANKKGDVKIIVERESIGNATPIQAILPIVMEDIKRKMEAVYDILKLTPSYN